MFDITRVVVVRDMIAPADTNSIPAAKTEEESTETIPWMHQDIDCMNFQHISIHATEVECEKCGIVVNLTEKNSIQKSVRRRPIAKKMASGQYNLDMGLISSAESANAASEMNILDSQRINGRNKLTKYIPQGKIFRSVGYDWNCDLIQEIVENNGYEHSTIIIGFNMSGSNDSETTILALHDLITQEKLDIRILKKGGPWHEKFFLIEGVDEDSKDSFWIDVNGSSNPTYHGSGKKGGQSNRITRIGFVGNYSEESYVAKVEADWGWYIENSKPFEGDLFDLLNEVKREERVKTITRYYSGEITNSTDNERTPVEIIRAKVGGELLRASAQGEKVVKLELSDFSVEAVDTYFSEMNELGFSIRPSVNGSVELPVKLLDSPRYTTDNIPYMKIENGSIVLRAMGDTLIRTNRDFNREDIALQLERIERYVDSIDNSHLPGIKTKMALSEYLLAGLCAPFDHLWMNLRKSKYKRVKDGPQMTSYFGGSGNGKSYASQYLLKMLSSLELDPLSSDDFTEKKVRGVAKNGSCMPLIFDDLKKKRISEWDKWGKFFWDRGYIPGEPHAQLLVTANDRISSQGNLGRRVREIWMEATFENSGKNTEIVESCLSECSEIFTYFSALVIDMYFEQSPPYEHLDPLKIGRIAVDRLYEIARKKKPLWWCHQPYNECVDANAYYWFDLLNKELFSITRKLDSFSIEIEETPHEINNRLKTFPAHLKATKAGSAISIGNADGMIQWLRKVSHLYIEEKGKPKRRMRRLIKKGF
jgi:hypothetical protein